MALGIGVHRVFIRERRGLRTVADLTRWVTSGQWERAINRPSKATVTLAGDIEACCAETGLQTIEPWAHEMLITRDGLPVWEGPLSVRPAGNSQQLVAFDILAWLSVRVVRRIHDGRTTPIQTGVWVYRAIDDAFGHIGEPPNVTLPFDVPYDNPNQQPTYTYPTHVDLLSTGTISTMVTPLTVPLPFVWDGMIAPHAGSIFDISTLGRTTFTFDANAFSADAKTTLLPQHMLGNWQFARVGHLFANYIVASGGDSTNGAGALQIGYEGPSPAAGLASRQRYGTVVRHLAVTDQNNATTTAGLTAAAAKVWRSAPPLAISAGVDGVLSCEADIDLANLMAGSKINVYVPGCDPALVQTRIAGVNCSWGPQGERVTVSLTEPQW